jgi:hypothetical protein
MKRTLVYLILCTVLTGSVYAEWPVMDDLIIELRADSLQGLADGDPVALWIDTAQEDAVDGTVGDVGSGTPEYRSGGLAGRPVVRFNGAEALSSAQFDFDADAGVTVVMVCTGDQSGALHERMGHFGAYDASGGVSIAMDICTDPTNAQGSGFRLNNGWSLVGNPNPMTPGWHVGVWQAEQETLQSDLIYYLDGVRHTLAQNNPNNFVTFPYTGNVVAVGNGHSPGGAFYGGDFVTGDLALMLVYNRVLAEDEVLSLSDHLRQAYLEHENAVNPTPAVDAVLASTFTTLAWEPGLNAASRNVYLSIDEQDVIAAAASALVATPAEPRLVIGVPGNPLPEGLAPGTVYYWRVDEVTDAGVVSPGAVWRFTLPPVYAYNPFPADEASYVLVDQDLSWETGLGAFVHYVYFGTNPDEVAHADAPDSIISNPPTGRPSVTPPIALEPDTTYYWRVDEFIPPEVVKGAVWSFATLGEIPVEDASLIGYWSMDQVDGASIVDMSGHGNHGRMTGDLDWVDGVAGSAIETDMDDLITVAPVGITTDAITMTGWIKPAKVHNRTGIVFMRAGASTSGFNLMAGNQLGYHWQDAQETWQYESGLHLQAGEWAFVGMVLASDRVTFFLDTVQITREFLWAHEAVTFGGDLTLGSDTLAPDRRFVGSMDELRFYSRALTVNEMEDLIEMGVRPEREIAPLVIDDFDGYAAYHREGEPNVWDVWADGFGGNDTGSQVGYDVEPFMERTSVVGGTGQSMPLEYDNSLNYTVSETSRSFSPAQDFTRGDALALKLWLRGDQANTVVDSDTLYVKLRDGAGQDATVALARPTDLLRFYWSSFSADLSEFGGVDLTRIVEITLGVGRPTAPQKGGFGTVWIDTVMLVAE